MVANDLAVIHRIISKARLKMFACIKEYQPKNIPHHFPHLFLLFLSKTLLIWGGVRVNLTQFKNYSLPNSLKRC